MTEPEWKTMNESPEKFLKPENYLIKAFSGILESIYPSETQGEKPVPYVKLDFEGGSSLSIFGLEYKNEDGTYPFGLGAFIKSAKALGLEVQEAELDGIVQGIRITENGVPLERPKIWIKGIEEKKVGDTSQNQSWFKWGVLEKYEVTATTSKKPAGRPASKGKLPAKPEIKESDEAEALSKLIIDEGLDTSSISDIYTHFERKYKVVTIKAAIALIK